MSDSLYSQPETPEAKADKPAPILPKTPQPSGKNTLSVLVGGVAIGVVIGAGGFVLVDNLQQAQEGQGNNVGLSSSSAQTILEAVKYKDGVYTANATFMVEAADVPEHSIRVTVEVRDEKVVSASVVEINEAGEAVENNYMKKFVDELGKLIVGKDVDAVGDMSLVTGSTLTSNAFKQAFAAVKIEAKNTAAAGLYEDGRYYGQARFDVPGLDREIFHNIGVTIELEDGVIANVIATEVADDGQPIANEHIDEFDAEVEKLIMGKTIDQSLDLDTVSGSSYTTIGFNEAMAQVKDQATLK